MPSRVHAKEEQAWISMYVMYAAMNMTRQSATPITELNRERLGKMFRKTGYALFAE